METAILKIDGMTCNGCVNGVTRVLHETTGVTHAQVDLANGTATVQFDPTQINVMDLISVVEDAGFDASIG